MQNTTNKTGNKIPGTPKSYLQLIQDFSPRKINSEEELDQTQVIIDTLLDRGKLTQDERDYLHLLGLLVTEYEEVHHSIPDISGIEVLKTLLEERNIELEQFILISGNEVRFKDILQHYQNMTVSEIEQLANFFQIPVTCFF
ncbi:helix-turn-helix domain-containing protein [Aphanothece sacrum]|uniref:DNA polymerase I n=1 Tax=Aphanothece sacrum FPU1 TaxID=1920663 RepID=A0A401IK87_APHSA|nr:transcriptional regulator [Aphanothece sacrum]GBF81531.1 DNA polymerase I [Aphanothece sacrum FPU1]GBF86335.1 DNA polymerase I [Aphanothece sacrum FPU3]